MLWDQVQYLVDPEANTAFKRSQRSWQRDFGQGFWWEKGRAVPSRPPDMGNAIAPEKFSTRRQKFTTRVRLSWIKPVFVVHVGSTWC